jgi:hypothetical protein
LDTCIHPTWDEWIALKLMGRNTFTLLPWAKQADLLIARHFMKKYSPTVNCRAYWRRILFLPAAINLLVGI